MQQFSQVLFLCTSNTLLSPLAEGIYRKNSSPSMPKAISRGLVVLFEEPIHPKCNMLLTKNGFTMSGHGQSRQLTKDDLIPDTLVLTMTLSEKVRLIGDFEYEGPVYTIGEFVGEDADMVNPSGGGDDKFAECFEEMVLRVNKAIHKIEQLYWEDK